MPITFKATSQVSETMKLQHHNHKAIKGIALDIKINKMYYADAITLTK